MAGNESTNLLSDVLSQDNDKNINKNYINIIIEEEIPVLCINQDTHKKRLMPFKVLYDNHENFWLQKGSWGYFLTNDGYNKLKEKLIVKSAAWDLERPKTGNNANPVTADGENIEELEAEAGYGDEYKAFANMSNSQKVQYIEDQKKRLNNLLGQKAKNENEVAEALVDTTKDVAMINHAALEEAIRLADDEAKKFTQDLVDSTREMVKSSAQLLSENIFNNDLMNTLVSKSNGTIVQHMTRVYLNGISFLNYYNNMVSTSSTIQRLRISFASKYRDFYHRLLPHINIDDINLERVF